MNFTSGRNELKRILNSHKIGECTTEEETAFITVFFRLYHPDWYNKTQGLMQVVTYKIKAETKHRSDGRCFWLILENGAEEDIGFRILNAHPADKEQCMRKNIAAACRTAVKQPSINPFRDNILKKFKEGLPVYSDLSGKPILDKGDFHIDHYDLTFEDLVEKWEFQERKILYLIVLLFCCTLFSCLRTWSLNNCFCRSLFIFILITCLLKSSKHIRIWFVFFNSNRSLDVLG